jgi:hypothetical protein
VHGQRTDRVAGVLHGLVRGPAGKEDEWASPVARPGLHQAMVEAEEVHTFPTNL